MELSIAEHHDNCETSFEALIDALQAPERDFGEQLSLASIREDYGRFKVWRGNVGAHHDPSHRISLDYRLRDSIFYRNKVVRYLIDLSEALDQLAQLVRGERLPFDECSSPTESSVISDSDSEDEEDEGESNSDGHEDSDRRRRRSSAAVDNFATLRSLLGRPPARTMESSVAFAETSTTETAYVAGDVAETEVVQLRAAIVDVLSHLYKLSMLIRRPIPQDRLTRSAKISMRHFEQFDDGYVQDCFPSARPWLQKRLAKAITRRRQHLVYNRKHHEKLSKSRTAAKSTGKQTPDPEIVMAPTTIVHGHNDVPMATSLAGPTTAQVSTRFVSTMASEFVPPKNNEDGEAIDWEVGTQSSYASTLGGSDVICIPPRPKDEEGMEMTQFECPYCFHIQEIHSSRAWRKHVLTDLTPYVCTFEHCTKSEAMFDSRSEWHTHELQFHRREWDCGVPDHGVYRNRSSFESHIRQTHHSGFSEPQLPTFIKSCERAVQAEFIECPLCTDDHQIAGDETKEPTIRRDPKLVSVRIFKRHLGRHLERLALFAISSTEDEAEEDGSLPSNNLNSGVSRLSWIDEDLSSNSAEGSVMDRATALMEKLASPERKSATDSATASTIDVLPVELRPAVESNNARLPCRQVRPFHKNPSFVGRKETFATLQHALDPQGDGTTRTYRQIFALCGSGGVGKTETAVNYVFEEMEKFQVVLWAHASSETQLIHSFSDFALDLGLVAPTQGKEQNPTIDADLLTDWFNKAEVPWLLIIDSADSLDDMDEYLPTGRYGSILITSRNASLVPKYGGMILGTLDVENAEQLLLESIKRQGLTYKDDARTKLAATKVVQRLGCFPLAITEAAHYIASNREKELSDFIVDYERNEIAHTISLPRLHRKLTSEQPFKLSILWNMSYNSMAPDQQTLLNTISFFDPTGIPLELISKGAVEARGAGSETLGFLKNELRFRRCKSALIKSSLVMQNEHVGQLWMHQLYQESAQARMSVDERQQSWDRAVSLLDAMWPVAHRSKRRRTDLWPTHTKYLPQVQSLAFWYRLYNGTNHPLQVDDRFAQLLVQAASFCLMRGFFEPVGMLVELAETYCSRCESDCELLRFEINWVKGGTHLQLNNFEPGLRSYEQAYSVLQRAVEKGLISADDDRFAIASGLMGNGCMAMNRFSDAEKWYLKAFQMWDTMDEETFKDKQLFVSNIATCLTFQGKLQEAEEIVLHSLKDKEQVGAFKLADTLYTLGNICIGQKNLDQAFENFKEAYALFKDDLGERHRLTANCCYCLGWLLNRQRKHNSAISMFDQALAAYEENPYYLNECIRTKYMLGTIQIEQGDVAMGEVNLDAARSMLKEIMPDADVLKWTENDYNLLVMPWSR